MCWQSVAAQMVQMSSTGTKINRDWFQARTASGRALWSPDTAVVKPMNVIKRLQEELRDKVFHFYITKLDTSEVQLINI